MDQVGMTNEVPVLLDDLEVFVRVVRRDLWVLIDAVHKVTSLQVIEQFLFNSGSVHIPHPLAGKALLSPTFANTGR
jgi:hypothetical protein